MLDLLYRYENGFVLIPVVLSCKHHGIFDTLRDGPGLRAAELAAAVKANDGHLAIALDMLRTLGWVDQTQDGRLSLTPAALAYRDIPDAILEIYETDGEDFLSALSTGALRPWLERCRARWPGVSVGMRDYLDGAVLVPLFVALARRGLLDRLESDAFATAGIEPTVIDALRGVFAALGFGSFEQQSFRLRPSGEFLLQRALFHGVPVSYLPMLRQMDALIFGDAAAVFDCGPNGREGHLDRALNVIASGEQHRSYFAEMQDLVVRYLDSLPLEEQPRYIVDVGCGDGTLLRLLYTAVATRSLRGRRLDTHPLVMVGVDFNPAALEETARSLADIPHLLLTGDIADPARMMADLAARGVAEADGVLHVRSFLDHDRVFRPPTDAAASAALASLPLHGRYVDRAGRAIPATDAVRSLAEHFARWSKVVSRHGLCVVEVHCLGLDITRRYLELTNSFHFQALQSFSGQQLVEADVFLMAAAQAGLLADPALSRRYPRAFPFTHITLNWLREVPFRIRYAETADLPALLELEAQCWAAPLRTQEAEIRRRLDACPEGCLVLERGDRVAAAIYSQRIARIEALERIRFVQVGSLHRADAPVVQILGLNVRPETHDLGLGGRLLAFFLHLCSLRGGVERACGITRFRNFPDHPELTLQAYLRREGPDGRPQDPILHFHVSHGARIRCLVPDYRPEDADNRGAGVLVEYDRLHGAPASIESTASTLDAASETASPEARGPQQIAREVQACVHQVLGRELAELPLGLPLMELGLDSLQLLELRMLLGKRVGIEIEPTVFFDYPSPRALSAWLADRLAQRASTAASPVGPACSGGFNAESESTAAPATRSHATRDSGDADRFAILGMACRFPGGVENPDGYWQLLMSGSDAIGEMPGDRRALLGLAADSPAARRRAGYLPEVDRFDAEFFGIPPAEADALDPQHRLLLELAWESLESAGIDPATLEESATGLFVGLFSHDYELLQVKRGDTGALGAWLATGSAAAMAAGRLAYFLGLRGPALTLDTACSSSLVAVHLACNSLRSGESDLALALGANLLLSPELTDSFAKAGMLAPDGRCKTFSADADGYVRSEGGVAVVLKRLDRALTDGDRIWAVIRGSAMNQDGASNGLTAPSGRAQQAVLRAALAAARSTPEQISYIELHGTGTPLGDPVEFEAIREVYGPTRQTAPPLLLGSVKTVVGHTEAAAGLAGLVKVVLAMQHRAIPPHLHLGALNPHIDLDALPAAVPTRAVDWPPGAPGVPRLAGVSSFGFSGTNAHVILEEAPEVTDAPGPPARTFHVLGLSARSDPDLRASAGRLAAWLGDHPESDPADFAYSQNTGRSRFEERAAWAYGSIADLRPKLAAFAAGEGDPPLQGRGATRPNVAFLFTGQGSQYLGMARGLYEGQPVFRRVLEACAQRLAPLLPRPLLEVLFEDGAALGQTEFAQPALFSIEMALVELLRSWGLVPDLVLGHSVGEYAAACTAGVFGLEEGLRLIAGRGRLMQALPAGGAMAAVPCAAERVMPHIAGIDRVGLAADNGTQAVISGPAAGVDEALARLAAAGLKGQRLAVSHAFHSALLEPMLDALAELAAAIEPQPPRLTLISNLTGKPLDSTATIDADYWRRHSREPVRFGPSIRALAEQGCELLLEIGPNPVLTPLAQRAWPAGIVQPRATAALRRGIDDARQIAEALATCCAAGAPIDWRGWDRPWPRRMLSLPGYAFQRRSHWIGGAAELRGVQQSGSATAPASRDPILERMRRAEPEQRPALLAQYVRRTVVASLKQVPDPLDHRAGFFDLGMDSLVAMALYNRLDTDLREACELEPTVIFDHPTLERLTEHLTELYLRSERRSPIAEPAAVAAEDEAIAIVGIGCRFPGADDPEAFWSLLASGRDPIGRVPPERWDADAWYDPDPDAPGRMWTREGGFLDDVAGFDAQFFGIAPREVPSMDPQHRLLLEVSWEALERAGIVPAKLAGSRTGVFVGICGNEYVQVAQSGGAESIDAYFGVGYAMSAAAGRLAYTLGLQGPALSIDTACSSSLVAVHQACRALQEGACELALAAGVNLVLNPLLNVSLTKARMLAPDGRCKTFSADADGYVRSDGCAVVVLRRLADARRAGDPILALIRGSAVNQDGRSGGLTVPNGPAQENVIRAALQQAGVRPAEVGYVEAHGTGTSLGDPIEVQALAKVFGEGRAPERPLRLGSVKSNIGHLEAAAGIAGLIKVVLALSHGRLPGQLHYRGPNPIIPWQRLPVRVVDTATDWNDGRRIAGLSSFGFTGTNAHAVIEQAPTAPPPPRSAQAGPQMFCISARSLPALRALVARYLEWLGRHGDVELADLCHTAAVRRSHWEERLAVVAVSVAELRERLAAWRASRSSAGVHAGRVSQDAPAAIGDAIARLPIDERAALYVRGAEATVCARAGEGRLLPLPTYAFQHRRYWVAGAFPPSPAQAASGGPLELPTGQTLLRMRLDPRIQTWLGDHRVDGRLIVPGAWCATTALAAFSGPAILCDLVLRQPLFLDEAAAREAQLLLSRPAEDGSRGFELYSEDAGAPRRWNLHATGRITVPLRGQPRDADPFLPGQLSASRAEAFYAACSARGLDYGPAFRAIRALELGDREATAALKLAERTDATASGAMHPALLDACLQVAAAAGGPTPRPLLPIAVERLELPAALPHQLYCRAAARRTQGDGSLVADLGVYDERGRCIGRVTGLVCRPLGAEAPDMRVTDWLYRTVWEESSGGTNPAGSYVFPSPAKLSRAVAAEAPNPAAGTGLVRRLEAMALQHVISAFADLGRPLERGARLSETESAQALGIADRHRRLWRRLFAILVGAGILEGRDDAWVVVRELAPVESVPVARTDAVEVQLLDRCGRALRAVLRGEVDPLALLFPRDGSPGAEEIYRDSGTVRALHRAAAALLAAAVADFPKERALRILEIGAGTGAASSRILPRLAGRSVRYAYTDLSSSFFERAEARFADFPFVEYRVFDIEQDPAEQGMAPGRWDILVAANVLHATRDLPRALAHARRLLAPQGLLLLVEAVVPRAWLDLSFGLLPGWWQFDDAARRDYPLLSQPEWQAQLQQARFPEIATVFAPDADGDQALILARASAEAAPAAERRTWLVLTDGGGLGAELIRRLAAQGDRCIRVEAGEFATRPGPDHYRVPPDSAAVLEGVVREACGNGLDGAIFLWGLDMPRAADADVPDGALRRVLSSALHLLRALALAGADLKAGFWMLTRGAQPVLAGEAPALWQTPLWGLAKVASIEHPEFRCRRVDLAPRQDAEEAQRLAAELLAAGPEDELALRGAKRLFSRLERVPSPEAVRELRIRSDATYLITGGLGGLGLQTARWLVRRGARHLALCGRSAPDTGVQAALEALRGQGAEVRVFAADVTRASDLKGMLEAIAAGMPVLRGVFHAAGVLDDGALVNQSWERFERVLRPKIAGAWSLHRLTRDLPLELYVLYSSTASMLGSSGQANHAAANSFLDALAHFRRQEGLPATGINWSAWSELGAAARPDVERRLVAQGIDMIPPEQGIAALEAILAAGLCQAGVLPMRRQGVDRAGALGRMRPERLSVARTESAVAYELRRRLDAAAPGERRGLLTEELQRVVAQALRLGAPEGLDPRVGFFELGMDSLMSLEIRGRILERLKLDRPLAVTTLFDHPNIERLAAFLLRIGWPEDVANAAQPGGPAARDPLAEEIGRLSDAELEAIIAEEWRTLSPGVSDIGDDEQRRSKPV
jgi:acyl transferase domain-containing protein/SAM-dependent methyltransferase/NAD(P)-dependent dehydrogenase (short-subunit alcohol dehydrogenase family)/acyl carrier protein